MDGTAPSPSNEAETIEVSAEFGASGAAPVTAPSRAKKRTTVTFYLTDAMRNRARAAYRQTSFNERDSSWSEMINKALLAEVRRRESVYNNGEVFVGNGDPLTPGRPIGY